MDEFELYHKRCRLCASEHRLAVNIFGLEGVALNLQVKIQTYLSIKATKEDELPKQVCYQCLYHIENFHNFKESCIEAEHTLRNWHLFYGGFPGKNDTSEEEESSNPPAEGDNSSSSKISVQSVAQPTSSRLSKIAQTAINTQQKQKMATYNEAMDTSLPSKSSSESRNSNPEGKVDILTKKISKNDLTNSGDKQDRQENSEVSRILLNMSGIGTISVTKFEGSREDSVTQAGSNEDGKETMAIKQNVTESIIISDDEDESDGFSGFDFEETAAINTTEEMIKDEEEDLIVAEFVPSDCVQIEHLEVDQNGEVTLAESDNPLPDTEEKNYEPEDTLRYTMETLDTPGETRYSCLMCNKTFSQKSYVKEHMKIHTGEKPFKCGVCGRCFRNNYMLKVHFRLHTGEKNFKCNECGALFTERGALVSHSRTHTGDKPFTCTFCDRKFAQNPALKRHLRIHTKEKPYTCEHCDASFADRGTWRNHLRTHTGERPYICTLCGKTFVQRTNLQAHIKTHTDERPFPCQVCESSFRTKAHLVKHLSTIHKDVMKSVVTFMNDPKAKLPIILKP